MELSVSIVLYNNKLEEIKKTINSVLSSSLHLKLYLVDNSPDDTLRILAKDPRIEYIPSHDNPGFGAGHNLAIKKSRATYHLILNPDVEFEKGVLEELFNYMENNPIVGNVLPKVFYKNGELQRLYKLLPTPFNLFGRMFAKNAKWAKKINDNYELRMFNYDKIVEIPNLSGCFMFTRTDILQKIGGFDERYFMYLEDIDLNRRIQSISKTVCYPAVSIIHGFKKESYFNKKLLKYHIKSAILYFNKWGWFFDKYRTHINAKTLKELNSQNFYDKQDAHGK